MSERETEAAGGESREDRLHRLLFPVVESQGVDLVEVSLARAGHRTAVRLVIHAAAGVTHGDCVRVTRLAGNAIDEGGEDLGSYVLEVSSPGTDRVLKAPGEFETFRGRRVRIRAGEGESSVEMFGLCAGITADGEVVLRRDDGEESTIAWSAVKKARLVPDEPESRGVGGRMR